MRHIIEIISYQKVAKLTLSKATLECVKQIKQSTSQSVIKAFDLFWALHGCFHRQKQTKVIESSLSSLNIAFLMITDLIFSKKLHLLNVAVSGFATIKVACDLCNLCTYPLGIFVKHFTFGNLGRNNDVDFTDLEKFCEELLDGKFNKDLFKELNTVLNFQNIKDSIIQFKGKFLKTLEL